LDDRADDKGDPMTFWCRRHDADATTASSAARSFERVWDSIADRIRERKRAALKAAPYCRPSTDGYLQAPMVSP
jgi:hypothetical protein